MELYFNKETKEYVFVDGKKTLTISEKEFNDLRRFGMSGILLKLHRDQARARESGQ